MSETKLDIAAQRRHQHVAHGVDALAQIDRHRHQLLAAREGEQLPRQLLAAAGGGTDRLHRLLFLRLAQAALQDLRIAGDDHQQIVEVVGDAAGQLAERFHLLRLRELLAGLFERDLRLALRGDVAGDLGEADQFAGVVADRVDDDAGVETAAILAHAPALRFVLPLARGNLERALGLARGAVLLGKEEPEMPADDFVGTIAFDAPSALVPVVHAAVGVEHVDRIVAHAFKQQSVALLRLAQRLFRLLALGHIDAHAQHADGGAVHGRASPRPMLCRWRMPPSGRTMRSSWLNSLPDFKRAADAPAHLRPVVGMDEAEEFLERAVKLLGRDAVDFEQLVRPVDPVRLDVPRPAAEIGRAAAPP